MILLLKGNFFLQTFCVTKKMQTLSNTQSCLLFALAKEIKYLCGRFFSPWSYLTIGLPQLLEQNPTGIIIDLNKMSWISMHFVVFLYDCS